MGCRKACLGDVLPLGVAWIIPSLCARRSSCPGESRTPGLQHGGGSPRRRGRRGFDVIGMKGGHERLLNAGQGRRRRGGDTPQLPDRLGHLLGLEPWKLVLALSVLVQPPADLEAHGTGILPAESLCDGRADGILAREVCDHAAPGDGLQREPMPTQSRQYGDQAQTAANRPHQPVHSSNGRLLSTGLPAASGEHPKPPSQLQRKPLMLTLRLPYVRRPGL